MQGRAVGVLSETGAFGRKSSAGNKSSSVRLQGFAFSAGQRVAHELLVAASGWGWGWGARLGTPEGSPELICPLGALLQPPPAGSSGARGLPAGEGSVPGPEAEPRSRSVEFKVLLSRSCCWRARHARRLVSLHRGHTRSCRLAQPLRSRLVQCLPALLLDIWLWGRRQRLKAAKTSRVLLSDFGSHLKGRRWLSHLCAECSWILGQKK